MRRKLLWAGVGLVITVVGLLYSPATRAWRRFAAISEMRTAPSCRPVEYAQTESNPLRILPTRYVADRWIATPVTTEGDTLEFFLDSGGGGMLATKRTLRRLGYEPEFLLVEGTDSVFTGGAFPSFRADALIPPPRCSRPLYGLDDDLPAELEDADGILGHTWFAGRVWVYDYPQRQLSVFEAPPPPRTFDAHTIPMTLKDPPRKNFPRIQVAIAGDTIGMLLDTGATSELTPEAVEVMGDGPAMRASAFVSTRLWNRWRLDHPTWRVIESGEVRTRAALIEVPSLSIAGYEVGPVWFAKRPDSVYDRMMNPQMDRAVDASLGGAALRTFRMTMDYPNQRVTFER
ncbi:MAG: hypothetical protein IBJ03_02230 [Gemmatimonadaceae bacterium]|nr:hypothetical protein [Gemmatimonadaceae bacterium]